MNIGNWLLARLSGLCFSLRIDFLQSHCLSTLSRPVLPKARLYVSLPRCSQKDWLPHLITQSRLALINKSRILLSPLLALFYIFFIELVAKKSATFDKAHRTFSHLKMPINKGNATVYVKMQELFYMDVHLHLTVSEGQESREKFPRCLNLKASRENAVKLGLRL